jgi:hypothetical protein
LRRSAGKVKRWVVISVENAPSTGTSAEYAHAYSGGILGDGNKALISGSRNDGTVIAISSAGNVAYAGGIEGYGSNITASYNTGNVNANGSADAYAGGISGGSSSLDYDALKNYNTGAVSAIAKEWLKFLPTVIQPGRSGKYTL